MFQISENGVIHFSFYESENEKHFLTSQLKFHVKLFKF